MQLHTGGDSVHAQGHATVMIGNLRNFDFSLVNPVPPQHKLPTMNLTGVDTSYKWNHILPSG